MLLMTDSSMIPFNGKKPELAPEVFVAAGARLIGDLKIERQSSVWFNTVVRADTNYITIGERTNIQDNSIVHVTDGGLPCIIGSDVTVGHNAVLHACTIEDLCLIGMGAIILDGAIIREGSIVGAGALVTQGKDFPPNSLIVGSPAKVLRPLTEKEREQLQASADRYVELAKSYRMTAVL